MLPEPSVVPDQSPDHRPGAEPLALGRVVEPQAPPQPPATPAPGRSIRRARARFLVRLVRAARALKKSTPYIAGEAVHVGWGPFAQAAYENRKLIAAEVKVRLARRCFEFGMAAPFASGEAGS